MEHIPDELETFDIWFGLQYSETTVQSTNDLSAQKELDRATRKVDNQLKTRCAGLLISPYLDILGFMKGNRRVQYLHRSTRDFLELEETTSFLSRSQPTSFDPKIALMWSTVQKIYILFETSSFPLSEDSSNYLTTLTLTVLLWAAESQHDEATRYVWLLRQLNDRTKLFLSTVQDIYWASITHYFMRQIEDHRYSLEHSSDGEMMRKYSFHLKDDLLSLAIIFGLSDYVEAEILESPSIITRKARRPYLDYALANCDFWMPR